MVGQDLMVQTDPILASVNRVQPVFVGDARGSLVPRARADLALILALDPPRHHVVPLFPRLEQVAEGLVDVIVVRLIQGRVAANLTTSLLTSARVTFWTRKLLVWPPERSMSKRSASKPGMMTTP